MKTALNTNIGFAYKWIWIFCLSLFLSYLNLHIKLSLTPSWFDGTLENNHYLLLNYDYTNNEQSRLLQFYIPELFSFLFNLKIISAYILQRLLFYAATFFLFYFFVSKWLNVLLSIICILILSFILPFTYQDHLQESAALLALSFIAALWSIRENRPYFFGAVLFIGSLNNETILFTPLIYFFVYYKPGFKNITLLLRKVFLISLPAYLTTATVRYITRDRPHLGGAWHLPENLYHLGAPFLIFNIFWILPLLQYKKLPLFLKRAYLSIPFFIIPHLLTGIIIETRQMIPMGFVIIPASILSLLALKDKVFLQKQFLNKSKPLS